MRVAAVQLNSQADVGENLRRIEVLLDVAHRAGTDVALLPEGFAFLGRDGEKQAVTEALSEGGPIVTFLKTMARRFGLHLIGGGFAERSTVPGRPFNTSLVVSPEGEVQASYRKQHLFDVELTDGTSFCESRHTTPGEGPVVCEIGGWRVGLGICYDLRFPEFFAEERAQGAEVLTLPAAFTKTTGAAHWHTLLRARAIETQCYVVAAAQVGTHPGDRQTFGHSMIVDPWGEVIGELPEGEGVLVLPLDRERLRSIREQMPVFSHKRGGR